MYFNIQEIPHEIRDSMKEKSIWSRSCPVGFKKLELFEVEHYDFSGNVKTGQMIIFDGLSWPLLQIFQELFAMKFPIHSMQLMDFFDGNDDLSMEANNSSCFNYRKIAGTSRLSVHSYGMAIDINPVQNPFITEDKKILPKEGEDFLDRTNLRPGMVEPIVPIFEKHGFEWGGNWSSPIDYHHFQIPRKNIKQLIKSS